MSSVQIRSGPIVWTQDLNGSTATTAFPSAATDGVAIFSASSGTPMDSGSRIHVRARYQVASGTMSTQIHLYGYDTNLTAWSYLASMNAGESFGGDGSLWSPNSSTIAVAETFTVSGENYQRYATRCINPGGTTPLVSTWIGYERG